jgi:hypothetical protein
MHRHVCFFHRASLLAVALVLALAFAVARAESAGEPARDAAWCPYAIHQPLAITDVETNSFYLTMRDGVKIAVSLHRPKSVPPGEKQPAILRSTRYMREVDLRWPFSIKQEGPSKTARTALANGYVWIDVDSRGSGASFGAWPCPWSADEVKDYGEIVEWTTRQPWSDGNVGCCGISYDGTTAEMTATTMHPAIKAVAPQFSLFDAYADIAYPGGILLTSFTRDWSIGNDALDRNRVQEVIPNLIEKLAVEGVMPVDDDRDRSLLRAAVASHQWNGNVYQGLIRTPCRDDIWIYKTDLTMASISPYGYADKLNQSGIPLYSWSGWFDGAYSRAAITRFLTVRTPGSKLVLGPWSHGGEYNADPTVRDKPKFDRDAELFRFFDRYLRGVDTGVDREPPVHYYTMVEEKWKAADSWPPKADAVNFYFASNNALSAQPPSEQEAFDTYVNDYTTATGTKSRWETLLGKPVVIYPDRAEEDRKLLTYTTLPLDTDTEVTGHPLVALYIASSATDGQFFAYLEDVDGQGRVTYVTEGDLRALHRKVSTEAPYTAPVPYHSYLHKDLELLSPGQPAELDFDMIPTSYLFQKGHSIRIALAGADRDHFDPPSFAPPTVKYFRDATRPSHMTLPVASR